MAVGHSPFNTNCIDTEQLYDLCITGAKIAAGTVTSDKIASGVLTQHVRNMVAYAGIGHATATTPISTIPSGSIVTGCIVSITEAYNGTASAPVITIGRTGVEDGLLADANITKTLNTVNGQDPALYGADLWVPGVSATPAQNGTTPFAVTAWPTPTTWGHARVHYLAVDTIYNAYITAAGSGGTTGTADVFILYNRVVMAD